MVRLGTLENDEGIGRFLRGKLFGRERFDFLLQFCERRRGYL